MRWPKWQISAGPGDFLPIVIGGVLLFISLPAAVLLLLYPDRNSGLLQAPLVGLLVLGVLFGIGFLLLGIQHCSEPGSLPYRLAHGRLFKRRTSIG